MLSSFDALAEHTNQVWRKRISPILLWVTGFTVHQNQPYTSRRCPTFKTNSFSADRSIQ